MFNFFEKKLNTQATFLASKALLDYKTFLLTKY